MKQRLQFQERKKMKSAYDFRKLHLKGYVNVNDILPIRHQLHACETLYGDLTAQVVILGQDAANAERMRQTIRAEGIRGYRHGESVRTNTNLAYALQDFVRLGSDGTHDAKSCNIFYANAVWLLKDTPNMSGALSSLRDALNVSRPVFDATLDGLPNARIIITLGSVAYQFLQSLNKDLYRSWPEAKEESAVQFRYRDRQFAVVPILHPSPLSGGKDLIGLRESVNKKLRPLLG